ncbi:MAG: hypothetical protein ACUVUG_06035, partial [Candidatus Aminicenantia bacterium]
SKIDEIYEQLHGSLNLFPAEEQNNLIKEIFYLWEEREENVKILFKIIFEDKEFPHLGVIGVVAPDWPGLSQTAIGTIHEKGWNIYRLNGYSFTYKNQKVGLIIIVILLEDKAQEEEFFAQKEEIVSTMKKVSSGISSKTSLLSEEARKLRIYSQVIDEIEKIYKDDDIDNIIGGNGEALKFFVARSREYIEERKVEDIARIIINNYKLVKDVREKKGPQVIIENIWTKKGEFTGITIAWFAKDIFLEDCLRALEISFPGYQIKHHKEFTTPDNITVIRLEIVDENGNPISKKEIGLIEKNLVSTLSKRKIRAQESQIKIGGFEHYARAIIPFLIKEAKETQKSQVFFSVVNASEFRIDFKIILAIYCPQKDSYGYRCISYLESIGGIKVYATNPLKQYGDVQVGIFDMSVDMMQFSSIEGLYTRLKKGLKDAIGDYRDFDEGMREIDSVKFHEIRKLLPDIEERELREIYFNIEDFYRMNSPSKEIAQLIKFIYEILHRDEDFLIEKRILSVDKTNLSVLGIISDLSWKPIEKIFNVLKDYEISLVRFERKGKVKIVVEINKERKALEEEELEKIKEMLKSL